MVQVERYAHETLVSLFQQFANGAGGAAQMQMAKKPHIGYLDGFLVELECKTIIVEPSYIDKDFLDDFAAYHVRSFTPYDRYCTRLHFFNADIDSDRCLALVTGADGLAEFQAAYLGFVVIKPLPETFVGRTCLKIYDCNDAQLRHYPVISPQKVNLYGIDLMVESLPFQEQDRDVAACATSALWSALNATGKLYQHEIPSPVKITQAASSRAGYEERMLPNGNGLTSRQMIEAIHSVGLEPITLPLSSPTKSFRKYPKELLKIATAAYLNAGIPCVLLTSIHDKPLVGASTFLGSHAVAVTGYRDELSVAMPCHENGILFAATRISKLYVHDDAVGPFARMEFDGDRLSTTLPDDRGDRGNREAIAEKLIVPLYHKVRIPVQAIINIALVLDEHINFVCSGVDTPDSFRKRLIWDVKLWRLDHYRQALRNSGLAKNPLNLNLLTRSLPRFIWVLSARSSEGTPLFDLLFDPTDLLQGRLYLDAATFDEEAFNFFTEMLAGQTEADLWESLPLNAIRLAMEARLAAD